jgi:Ca2+:H+ antiporter
VTEQVGAHTNGTIGALLAATFGNAPELLISTAALRNGFYRVTQLTMLGSMLCNLLMVFGLACLVGGVRWQVQELRITSGNVSVGMLLASVGGSILPAALILSGQLYAEGAAEDPNEADTSPRDYKPSSIELSFSRVNAVIMMSLYIAYLTFQVGTHREEFNEEENVVETQEHLLVLTPHYVMRQHGRQRPAQRNLFCLKHCLRQRHEDLPRYHLPGDVEMVNANGNTSPAVSTADQLSLSDDSQDPEEIIMPTPSSLNDNASSLSQRSRERRRALTQKNEENDGFRSPSRAPLDYVDRVSPVQMNLSGDNKSHESDAERSGLVRDDGSENDAQMSLRTGIVWLFMITLCISAMSDILVDTIDGFAYRLKISEVFTSMVIVPFFSNIAEQVSAVLFAYRNKMDLCVGVTVGSAIQVALFVLPGCVLIGMFVDRSMTLYFRGYETCCLLLAVITVAAVLQGGTTNWLVGFTLIGIYVMMASGFYFHELENLSTDAEIAIQNSTGRLLDIPLH